MRPAVKVAIVAGLLLSASGLASEPREGLIDMSKPVVATVGDVEFRECILEAQERDRSVQCAWHQVPEDYANPDGKSIQIFIARIPAGKPKQEQEPMLLLAGGPGQSASQSYLHITGRFSSLAKERDFYLVDQRGTGHSNFLGCDDSISDQNVFLIQDQPGKVRDFVRQCLSELPGDPRFYTTSVAIRDFEAVREALGVPQWNLFGASYGTRVALHYMRRHSDAIRSAVLDSVVPPGHILGTDIAILSQKILSHLYERCRQEPECNQRFPDLESEVDALFSRLDESPLTVSAESFRTGKLEEIHFTRSHLVMLVRMYLYNSRSLALLPPMLHEATGNENFAPIARAAQSSMENMDDMLSPGMHNAVLCSEDAPFLTIDEDLIARHEQTYMGADFVRNIENMCSVWPVGVVDEDFREPLESGIPTLLLSGEYDPITPPEYAEQVLEGLTNARHLVIQGQGHFVSIEGCAPHVLAQFVSEASVDQLNTACLDRLSESPLFINFNGPSP